MSDREPRSRRKRKAAQEKAALETSTQPKAPPPHKNSSDSEAEEDAIAHHGRSSTAKVAFIVVFTALAFALAAVLFSLYGTSGTSESVSSVIYSQPEPLYVDDAVAQNEINKFLERPPDTEENYATGRGEPSGATTSSDVPYESADESHASAASTPEIQSSVTEPVAVEWTSTESAFTIDAIVPVPEVPVYNEKQADKEESRGEPLAEMPESLTSSVEAEVQNEFPTTSAPELEVPSSPEMSVQTSEATQLSDEQATGASSIEATVSEVTPGSSHLTTSTVEVVQESEHPPTEDRKSDTSAYDDPIESQLQEAAELLEKFPDKALSQFNTVLRTHPFSARATYGKGRAFEKLAELRRSNAIVEDAIKAYLDTMGLPNVPKQLYLEAGERCVDRMRFLGTYSRALKLQLQMSEKFPQDMHIKNQIAVSYLMIGHGTEASKVLQEVLKQDPSNGFAKAHYGFILKTENNDLEGAIKYMSEGIATKEPGVIDGRFYFHLGDALARTGQAEKAMHVYTDGVKEGLFFSVYQRSLYNVHGLKAQPWWRAEETPYVSSIRELENHWQEIRGEAVSLMDDRGFLPEAENLRDTGDWKQFEIFARGHKIEKNCRRAPKTCALVAKVSDAANCKRGQVKFSIMYPGTHVWAHTGPTNCRLRAHLGLVVPPKVRIRVANETRAWKEGKFIIFDDSFEHEVWHEGDSFRLVLIVDFWHPGLTPQQKASLAPI